MAWSIRFCLGDSFKRFYEFYLSENKYKKKNKFFHEKCSWNCWSAFCDKSEYFCVIVFQYRNRADLFLCFFQLRDRSAHTSHCMVDSYWSFLYVFRNVRNDPNSHSAFSLLQNRKTSQNVMFLTLFSSSFLCGVFVTGCSRYIKIWFYCTVSFY